MAYKNYVNKFYSQRGNRYDIEIWSKTDSSLSSVEFATGKGGFKLSYKGGDDRQDITMPSEVTIPFIVKNANDEAFINGLLTADDKEYFVVIKRNFVNFWWGNLNAGFDSKDNNFYPYISTIKANDFLGEIINNKSYSNITNIQTSLSVNTIKEYIDISQLDEWNQDIFPFGSDELIFKTNMRWTAPNQLSYNDLNSVFNTFFINPQGFEGSSNYVNKYKKSDTFKEVLKAFGLKIFEADGKIYCLQPYNYINDTNKFQNYKTTNTNTYYPVDNDIIDNRQNANNDITSATDENDGFQSTEWILEPADFTDSIWQANGSCTQITSNSFNVALITSNLYIDLAQGEYCVSYSENDLSVYIAKEEGGLVTSLLTESGHKNFSIGAGGGELRVYTSIAGTLTVKHIGLQKGAFTHRTFLADNSFRYDRPISTVTATFPFGSSSARALSNFPNTDDTNTTDSIYTTLTSIGAISTNAAETIFMRFNVFYGERFDFTSAANNFTHVGGELELKLKIGSFYLTGLPGNFSWSSTSDTFTLPVSIAPLQGNINDNFWINTTELLCQSFAPNLGDNYYFGIPGSAGSTGFVGVNYTATLPPLTAGGDVQLQFVNGTINYYINPDTSNPNTLPTPLTPVKNNLITKWFTGSKYNYDNPGVPKYFEIIIDDTDDASNGIEYSASSEFANFKRVELGNIKLGTTGDETTHLNSIKVLTSNGYEVPTHLNVNNTGENYQMTSLLLEQYLEPQIKPLEIIEGQYYLNDFSAFKSVVLDGNKYVFFEGSLNAENDSISGSWYKIAASTESITTTEDTVIYVEDDTPTPPPPPNPHDPPIPNEPVPEPTGTSKGRDIFKYNSIGLSDAAISSTDTKIGLLNVSRSKLYTGQKLIFTRPDLSYPIILTKDGDSDTTATQIDVGSFDPRVTYPAGSILSIANFDLTNVITGGGGTSTPNLFQGITTTAIYLAPNEFHVTTNSSVIMYTRNNIGSVQPSSYVSRSKAYAKAFIPLGYKVTAVDVDSNQNRNIAVLSGRWSTDVVTSQGTGTANTTLTLGTAWTSIEGDYIIVSFEFGASTDKINGAKITIEAV